VPNLLETVEQAPSTQLLCGIHTPTGALASTTKLQQISELSQPGPVPHTSELWEAVTEGDVVELVSVMESDVVDIVVEDGVTVVESAAVVVVELDDATVVELTTVVESDSAAIVGELDRGTEVEVLNRGTNLEVLKGGAVVRDCDNSAVAKSDFADSDDTVIVGGLPPGNEEGLPPGGVEGLSLGDGRVPPG